jgi:hypothetical protein
VRKLRRHVALAIDGGGIRGVMIARALAELERAVGRPLSETFGLLAGTSTGSIIAAAIASGMSAQRIHELYRELGRQVFPRSIRSVAWPLFRWRYSGRPLAAALQAQFGDMVMADFWSTHRRRDVVIVVRDLVRGTSRFIKSWRPEYADFPVWKAVLASSAVPTYFPVVDGRYVDGGFGAYSNPCSVAAWEAVRYLGWRTGGTTLISIGSGRTPDALRPFEADGFWPLQWLRPVFDTFLDDTSDQQVRIVRRFYPRLDFRRFQIDIPRIEMDDASRIDELSALGERLGKMIVEDETDARTAGSWGVEIPDLPPRPARRRRPRAR